jgi:hypothetical protein
MSGCSQSKPKTKAEPVVGGDSADVPEHKVNVIPKKSNKLIKRPSKGSNSPLKEYLKTFERMQGEFERANQDYIKWKCVPSYLEVVSTDNRKYSIDLNPFSAGADGYWVEPSVGLLVSSVTREVLYTRPGCVSERIIREYLTEAAFLTCMSKLPGFPRPFKIKSARPSLTEKCKTRSFVRDGPRGESVESFLKTFSSSRSNAILELAIAGLEYAKRFHKMGFVHGKMDKNSIRVMFGKKNEFKVVSDYYRHVEAYIEPATGEHVQNAIPGKNWCPDPLGIPLMSPWQLEEKSKYSRRDDVFKVAEMVMDLVDPTNPLKPFIKGGKSKLAWSNFKRDRLKEFTATSVQPGPAIAQFYKQTLNLRFEETPNYDAWIAELRAAIVES